MPEARPASCPACDHKIATDKPGRVKHKPDGSHTFVPAAPLKRPVDVKVKGRPRA